MKLFKMKGIYIYENPEDFLKVMEELQEAYNSASKEGVEENE